MFSPSPGICAHPSNRFNNFTTHLKCFPVDRLMMSNAVTKATNGVQPAMNYGSLLTRLRWEAFVKSSPP